MIDLRPCDDSNILNGLSATKVIRLFLVCPSSPRKDAKRGDHFLQADFWPACSADTSASFRQSKVTLHCCTGLVW